MQFLDGGEQAHVGVQDAFLDSPLGLLCRKSSRFLVQFVGADRKFGGSAVPKRVGGVNACAQAVVVLRTVAERGIVKGVADAGRNGGVVRDLRLFDAHVGLLFADFGRFELEALFFGLLEARA